MSTSAPQIIYNSKNAGKYKKEKLFTKLKDYYLKIALTGDNKLLFRCYDINKLDCCCYQLIKSVDEIFDLYTDMKIYETSSVLFNVITKRFNHDYQINYDKNYDIINIETNDSFNYHSKIKFQLYKEGITCLKEYIYILCQTIKQLKEDASNLKETKSKYNYHIKDITKIPNIYEDVQELKKQVQLINTVLNDKQAQIDLLKKEKDRDKKILTENNSQIKLLKEENKNLKISLKENQEDIESLNKKTHLNYPKFTLFNFNRKYRTNIGHNLKNLYLEGSFLGNIGLRDLCKLEFIHLEKLNLSNNFIKDITPLENANFIQLKELIP